MKTFVSVVVMSILSLSPVVFAQAQTAAREPSLERAAAARAFVETLARGEFADAGKTFDETLRATFPTEKLQELWKTLNTQVGALKRVVGARVERVGEYDAAIVTCEFERTGIEVKVVYTSAGQITGLFFAPVMITSDIYRAPAYVRAAAFQSKETVVGAGEWALPATLTLPVGKGPFPAVVLVHGSGPNDRDETIGPNKPFRDIAEGLASQGVAVLRYEKRTKAHAAKLGSVISKFTVKEEVTDDALAAVALLRKTEGIDARRIFVLGHSLGATVAPRIARADAGIAGLIIMAGVSGSIEDVLVPQFEYVFSVDGKITPEEQAQLDAIKRQVAKLKDPQTTDATPASEMPLGVAAHYWLDLRGYRAPIDARDLKQPMLIMQGERDYQVTMREFEGWKILAARKNVQFKSYPKLNHLFIEGEGPKSVPAEYAKSGNVAQYVIDDIAAWIKSR
jgi:dienelactone hydrolase